MLCRGFVVEHYARMMALSFIAIVFLFFSEKKVGDVLIDTRVEQASANTFITLSVFEVRD